ncbi:hypothetical protein ZPR_2964 [Zunongwangia profunda SM-A87]|uniref:Uncharacterized protein n=1 Tax=Zunongwangia profunda (strain DSM 18752 / CCTCC AB 206139 / SM-A87) TaxID=655815 RepID=D5BGV3_ZUNPS|nr:hypothetical protein ZPR_2964 [Zunongwangia profunda SM-A87]
MKKIQSENKSEAVRSWLQIFSFITNYKYKNLEALFHKSNHLALNIYVM